MNKLYRFPGVYVHDWTCESVYCLTAQALSEKYISRGCIRAERTKVRGTKKWSVTQSQQIINQSSQTTTTLLQLSVDI